MEKEDFISNLNYALLYIKKAINEAYNLEDKIYLELSKQQIIEYFNYIYTKLKHWENCYKIKDFKIIRDEYKEVESIISELELCLTDYNNLFNIEGISYSIFKIGKFLS